MKATRTPKQSRSRATYGAIVDAATRILVENDAVSINTNLVARVAGVSIGSLYEYFPNKQALVDAIALRHLEQAQAIFIKVAGSIEGYLSKEEVVEKLVETAVLIHQDNPELHRKLSSQVVLSDSVKIREEQLKHSIVKLLSSLLSLQTSDPMLVAQLLFDCVDAVVHKWYIDEQGKNVDKAVLKAQLVLMLNAYVQSLD